MKWEPQGRRFFKYLSMCNMRERHRMILPLSGFNLAKFVGARPDLLCDLLPRAQKKQDLQNTVLYWFQPHKKTVIHLLGWQRIGLTSHGTKWKLTGGPKLLCHCDSNAPRFCS